MLPGLGELGHWQIQKEQVQGALGAFRLRETAQ